MVHALLLSCCVSTGWFLRSVMITAIVTAAVNAQEAQKDPEALCLQFAADPNDPMKTVPGVADNKISRLDAYLTCLQAMNATQDRSPALRYAFARAAQSVGARALSGRIERSIDATTYPAAAGLRLKSPIWFWWMAVSDPTPVENARKAAVEGGYLYADFYAGRGFEITAYRVKDEVKNPEKLKKHKQTLLEKAVWHYQQAAGAIDNADVQFRLAKAQFMLGELTGDLKLTRSAEESLQQAVERGSTGAAFYQAVLDMLISPDDKAVFDKSVGAWQAAYRDGVYEALAIGAVWSGLSDYRQFVSREDYLKRDERQELQERFREDASFLTNMLEDDIALTVWFESLKEAHTIGEDIKRDHLLAPIFHQTGIMGAGHLLLFAKDSQIAPEQRAFNLLYASLNDEALGSPWVITALKEDIGDFSKIETKNYQTYFKTLGNLWDRGSREAGAWIILFLNKIGEAQAVENWTNIYFDRMAKETEGKPTDTIKDTQRTYFDGLIRTFENGGHPEPHAVYQTLAKRFSTDFTDTLFRYWLNRFGYMEEEEARSRKALLSTLGTSDPRISSSETFARMEKSIEKSLEYRALQKLPECTVLKTSIGGFDIVSAPEFFSLTQSLAGYGNIGLLYSFHVFDSGPSHGLSLPLAAREREYQPSNIVISPNWLQNNQQNELYYAGAGHWRVNMAKANLARLIQRSATEPELILSADSREGKLVSTFNISGMKQAYDTAMKHQQRETAKLNRRLCRKS